MEEGFLDLWFIVGAVLVFFMQAGFAMVESGFTRAKNAGNIIMKNMMDFSIGAVVFVLIGYSLMMGTGSTFFGFPVFDQFTSFADFNWADFFFQLVFCATATTIVSGAMAERTKFSGYLIVTIVICAIIYPIEAHWVWGGGWLSEMGYVDWAGSSVIHMVGGTLGLLGAAFLGPRIGKYDANKNSRAIQGHNITLAALGVFILWFGWYGFNGAAGGTVAEVAAIFSTTTIAAALAAIIAMVFTWIKNGKPDVSFTLNGALAGLVGITAGCQALDAVGAAVVGIVCGFLVVICAEFVDKKCHIDDPVGAFAVHGVCGAVGTIMVGLFAQEGGLFYGGGAALLGIQCIGVLAILAWTVVTGAITFLAVKYTIGLRATETEEVEGLDATEHGLLSAYADFLPTVPAMAMANGEGVDVSGLAPVAVNTGHGEPGTLTKVSIMCAQEELAVLKDTLAEVGVMGMTVTTVMGCGVQKGKTSQYRGITSNVNLLPKFQVDVVVGEVDPGLVVAAAQKALRTGNAGDGKIFISQVSDVFRISTGQTGVPALSYDGK